MLNRTGQRVWLVVALLMAAALLGGLLQPAGRAFAHPLGNFTINRYARVEVYRDTIRIHYALDFAEIPTLQLAEEIDTDGDKTLSPAELQAWAASREHEIASRLDLSLGGAALQLRVEGRAATVAAGQAGLVVLRLAYVFEAPAKGSGVSAILFADHNYEGRAGWREIVIAPSAGADVTVDARFLEERSQGLTAYPENSLTGAPADQSVTFTWRTGSGSPAPAVTLGAEATAVRSGGSGFASLLDNDRSFAVILFSLLAALGFGALHALGPGHGKSVVAAYLVGSRGTARHALALGLTVTATHTSTVYLLGFVTLALSQYIVPEQLYLYLGVASGAMVVAMGIALFVGRLRGLRRGGSTGGHRHGLFGRTHSHEPHPHEHGHAAPADGPAVAVEPTPRVGWRGLLTLGVAGGLLPCPSAIVVMLAAISLGQVVFGMLLIVAFSLGLAGVLMAIGLALVWGRRLSGRSRAARVLRQPAFARLATLFPILTAAGLTAAGAVITFQAWTQPGL